MALNTALLFLQPEYSDIIFSYSGRKTFCHKIIICQSSEYFKKLCGPGSHFAESKQDIIELQEDDPDAVFRLLRWVYHKDIQCGDLNLDYALLLEIAKVAQKYLYPELHSLAIQRLRLPFTGVAEPMEMLQAITDLRNSSDGAEILQAADDLEHHHSLALMQIPEFRDRIDRDREEMWKYLDEYRDFKAGLTEMKMVWCDKCGGGTLFSLLEAPAYHTLSGVGGPPTRHRLLAVSCWLPDECRSQEFLTKFNKTNDLNFFWPAKAGNVEENDNHRQVRKRARLF